MTDRTSLLVDFVSSEDSARWSPKYSRGGTLEPNKEVLALSKAKPEEGARTSLFGVVEDANADSASEDSSVVKVQQPMKTPMLGPPQYFAQSLDAHDTKLFPSETLEIADNLSEGNNLVITDFVAPYADEDELFHVVTQDARRLADEREDSVQAHSLDVHEGNDDPALMKKPEPPDIKKVMERRLGQQETKSPPRRLVRRKSLQGKWGERKR